MRILDIDHRYVQVFGKMPWTDFLNGSSSSIVPAFTGLRRFPDGCGLKQWTGDDSKDECKVFYV